MGEDDDNDDDYNDDDNDDGNRDTIDRLIYNFFSL